MRWGCPSVCLSVCRQNAKTRFFFQKPRYDVYWRPIGSRTWAFQITQYWTPKIQDSEDPPSWKSTWRHFYAEGSRIWIKFRRLVQNDMLTAVIWSKSKPEAEFQYGGRFGEFSGMPSQSHVPHCRVKEFHPPYWKSFFAVFYLFLYS